MLPLQGKLPVLFKKHPKLFHPAPDELIELGATKWAVTHPCLGSQRDVAQAFSLARKPLGQHRDISGITGPGLQSKPALTRLFRGND